MFGSIVIAIISESSKGVLPLSAFACVLNKGGKYHTTLRRRFCSGQRNSCPVRMRGIQRLLVLMRPGSGALW